MKLFIHSYIMYLVKMLVYPLIFINIFLIMLFLVELKQIISLSKFVFWMFVLDILIYLLIFKYFGHQSDVIIMHKFSQ